MAAKASAASPAATEHSDVTLASIASPAATEHSDVTPPSELLNQECGQTGAYDLKVVRAEIVDYKYPWQGKQIATQKVQALLQSHKPDEYCLGVAKRQKKDLIDGRDLGRGRTMPGASSNREDQRLLSSSGDAICYSCTNAIPIGAMSCSSCGARGVPATPPRRGLPSTFETCT